MKKFNKIMSSLLAAIMLAGSVSFTATEVKAEASLKTVEVIGGTDLSGIINYNGKSLGHSAYFELDGNKYPAFCVDPIKGGAAEHPDGQYEVSVAGTNNEPMVATVLHNSVPYKKAGDLGGGLYVGLNEDEIYAATKAAIRAVSSSSSSLYPNDSLWASANPLVAEFARYLISLAKNNTEDVPELASYGPRRVSGPIETVGEIKYVYKVLSTTYPMEGKAKVTLTSDALSGAKILNSSGVEASEFAQDEEFSVVFPKSSIPENTEGEFTIHVALSYYSDVILFGEPIAVADQRYQRYEIPLPIQEGAFDFKIPYDNVNTDPEPSTGGLKVLKYNNKTGQLVAGAMFAIKGVSDGTREISFQVQASAGASLPNIANGATVATSNGLITVSGIPAGEYQITEIAPPANFDVSLNGINSQVVTVQSETEATVYPQVTFRNNPYGTLEITKIDSVSGKALDGVTLRIRNPITGFEKEIKTANGGKISIADLPQGNYEITEVATITGYELSAVVKMASVFWGEKTTVSYNNEPYTSIEIVKISTKTNTAIEGAVFWLTDLNTNKQWTLTTLSDGKAHQDNIPAGNYTIREIYVPNAYILDTTIQNIQIDNDKVNRFTFKNDTKPKVTLLKYDEKTGELIGGAEFRLEKQDGSIIEEFMVDSSGTKVIENLEPGAYTFTEIAAPDGYLISTEHKDFVLKANDEVVIKFDNRPRPVLEIKKIDSITGEALAGAKFKVTKTEDKTVSEYVTDSTGIIKITNLDEAVYTIEEIAAPNGYLIDTQQKQIALEWGKTKTLVFTNNKRPILEIKKIDSVTGETLAGAKFKVTKTEDSTVSEYVTDSTGVITITNLDEAIYTIEEVLAPDGYLIDTQHKDIQLEWGKSKTVVFTNNKRPVLEIKKVDSVTGEALAGAKFKVTKTEDKTVSEYVTDSTGVITITSLDEAVYTVEEILAPDGYITEMQQKEIALEWGKTKTLIYNNTKKPTLIITKINGLTGKPIAGATFKIQYEASNGGLVTIANGVKTNAQGQIVIPKVATGWYVVTETLPAPGFQLSKNPVTRIFLTAGQNAYSSASLDTDIEVEQASSPTLTTNDIIVKSGNDFVVSEGIINYPLNSLVIKKVHAITGEMLAGAVFEVRKVTEELSGTSGTVIGRYTTDNSGIIVITGLESGGYIVEEVQAPTHFLLSENSQQQTWLKPDGTSIVELTFSNYPYGSLLITKVDALTNLPLSNAKFKVTDGSGTVAGNSNGEYITDSNGEILIPHLKPNSYVITELVAPDGYVIDTTPQTIQISTDGKTYKVSFQNQPIGTIVIKKYDSVSKEPLADAEFKITNSKGEVVGTSNGTYKTNETGTITIPNLPKDTYVLQEIKAPTGYLLENQTQTIAVDYGKSYVVDFYNHKMSGLQIIKIDGETKETLKDAKFTLYKKNGEIVGQYVTDGNGLIIIDNLASGWYKIVETKAPDGYMIDETAQDIEITNNQFVKVVFENKKLTSLIIKKVDDSTGAPLSGAKFIIEKQNGEHVGEFTTDKDGLINVPTLNPDWYIVRETKAPANYLLDETPKTVQVKTNVPTITTFTNKKLTSLVIQKTDEITGKALAGAVFSVEKLNGEHIGTYTTDSQGLINLPTLQPDWYVVKETKAPSNYILDSVPQTVEVKTNIPTTVKFTNKQLASILIIKTDMQTKKPLAGVKFDVAKANGEKIGSYTTDKNGRINANDLDQGKYIVTENQALSGYELDTTAYEVSVISGRQTTLEVQNKPLSGLKILKIDSITGAPIYNVEFMVFDHNGKVVGTFYTDNMGVIDFSAILVEGRYTIRETRAAQGYYRDDVPRTVEFIAGKMTVITWKNIPEAGQIQILKLSADDNQMNGLPVGTPLAGAIFEVYAYKSGNLVDRFITGADGRGISNPLPLGRYYVKETQAPQFYKINTKQIDLTIEFATQIVKAEFTNESVNLGVSIDKVAPKEVVQGQQAMYTFKTVRNDSTVALNDFFWRDILPTDVVRLDKIVTGTYNQSLKYKVTVMTNKGNNRVIGDNFMTTKNNVIGCSNAELGLASDEFVVSFTLYFGNVKAGFTSVDEPKVYVNVLNLNLPNQYQFANKADIGGKYGDDWVIGNTTALTTVYNPTPAKLPKTGK